MDVTSGIITVYDLHKKFFNEFYLAYFLIFVVIFFNLVNLNYKLIKKFKQYLKKKTKLIF
jgi:hypothetical protein